MPKEALRDPTGQLVWHEYEEPKLVGDDVRICSEFGAAKHGTELAFQWFGAPWLDPGVCAAAVNDAGISGVRARPQDLPRNDTPCPGVRLEVTDASALRPVYMGLRLLTLLRTFWPEKFEWAAYPTAVNPTGGDHLYRLLSSRALVSYLEKDPGDIGDARLRQWTRAQGWWERAEPHLLYF